MDRNRTGARSWRVGRGCPDTGRPFPPGPRTTLGLLRVWPVTGGIYSGCVLGERLTREDTLIPSPLCTVPRASQRGARCSQGVLFPRVRVRVTARGTVPGWVPSRTRASDAPPFLLRLSPSGVLSGAAWRFPPAVSSWGRSFCREDVGPVPPLRGCGAGPSAEGTHSSRSHVPPAHSPPAHTLSWNSRPGQRWPQPNSTRQTWV